MKQKNLLIILGLGLALALVFVINVQAGASKIIYLDWHNVVPAGSGDPNMFGDATITAKAGQAQLCYTMRVLVYPSSSPDWPPTGAGIYHAPAGSNGPLVVDLNPDPSSWTNASGCINIDSALAHDIQRNPTQYYLLVTDSSHPGGAARAQLIR